MNGILDSMITISDNESYNEFVGLSGRAVSRKYSNQMLNLLLAQERRYKIPAGLPSGVKSGNKTGETDSYQHDAAIVYGKKTDYVIVVFAQVGEYTGINGIKGISGMVYERLN